MQRFASKTNRIRQILAIALAVCLGVGPVGCGLRNKEAVFDDHLSYHQSLAKAIEYADANDTEWDAELTAGHPMMLSENANERQPRPITPEEAIEIALANSSVLRDLGGLILQAPHTMRTIHLPALQETDPRFGVEAALSEFDASFRGTWFAEKNHQQTNDQFSYVGGDMRQDLDNIRFELNKRAATGTQYFLRHNIDYESINKKPNLLLEPSFWNTNVEAEFRHPLLRGSGVDYNRIAGPSATPGVYGGVVIARLNVDMSLAEFEMGLRDLVSNVENAYWDLYLAYRDLESKMAARDAAYTAWQNYVQRDKNSPEQAAALEQYYRLHEQVQNLLTGRMMDDGRGMTPRSVATIPNVNGVHVLERRLRMLIGLPINDGTILVPSEEPSLARVTFDWDSVTNEALARRSELRRQRLSVKRRQLELAASRNFLLPRFDVVGRYRIRGFGDDLISTDTSSPPFPGAYENMFDGDYQEWRVGAELEMPVGFRQGHSAVRNAQLHLARERALLAEQERRIVHDLSNAWSNLDRAYEVTETAFNRRVAAEQRVKVLETQIQELAVDPDEVNKRMPQLMDARRIAAEAQFDYYQCLVDCAVAVKNMHYEKGTLLEYNNIALAEELCLPQASGRSSRADQALDYRLPYDPAGQIPNPQPSNDDAPPAPDDVAPSPSDLGPGTRANPVVPPPPVPLDNPPVPGDDAPPAPSAQPPLPPPPELKQPAGLLRPDLSRQPLRLPPTVDSPTVDSPDVQPAGYAKP